MTRGRQDIADSDRHWFAAVRQGPRHRHYGRSLAALLFNLAFPEVSLDSASVAVLVLAAVPRLGAWIKSVEVAGMRVEFNDLREQLSQVCEQVTEGFETQPRQQEPVIARVARIESLLEFSGLPVADERQERITDLVPTFLAEMRERGAKFGVSRA